MQRRKSFGRSLPFELVRKRWNASTEFSVLWAIDSQVGLFNGLRRATFISLFNFSAMCQPIRWARSSWHYAMLVGRSLHLGSAPAGWDVFQMIALREFSGLDCVATLRLWPICKGVLQKKSFLSSNA